MASWHRWSGVAARYSVHRVARWLSGRPRCQSDPVRAGAERPILVVGCGRSGTTVLYEVLCEHPGLAWYSNWTDRFPGRPALGLLHRARWLGRPSKGSSRLARARPHPVEGHATWDHCSGQLAGGGNRPLTAADVTPEAAARTRSLVAEHVRRQGASRFLNKNTRNTRRIPYLASIFPEARFVHVIRDPIDTARSLSEVAFWPDLPIWWADDRTPAELAEGPVDQLALAGRFWARELEVVRRDAAALGDDQLVEVRYEELVARPAEVVTGLLQHLEVDPSPAVERSVARRLGVGRGPSGRPPLDAATRDRVWTEVGDEAARWGYEPG